MGNSMQKAFLDWTLLLLQVATQRVKTAQKAEIPHIDEPVSKIENVGVQTQNKLQDIKAAAEQIGVHGLSVVHNCITTGWLATISALDFSGAKYEFQCIWMVHQPTVHICGMEQTIQRELSIKRTEHSSEPSASCPELPWLTTLLGVLSFFGKLTLNVLLPATTVLGCAALCCSVFIVNSTLQQRGFRVPCIANMHSQQVAVPPV